MIFLLPLLGSVVIISFLLAYWSMKDFKVAPKGAKSSYGLFLIRNTSGLTPEVLHSIMNAQKDVIISLERLFKGTEAALAIYAPTSVLMPFLQNLNLLELEDYVDIETSSISLWEVGLKIQAKSPVRIDRLPFNILKLKPDEQIWVQLLTKGAISQIRVASVASSPLRRKEILEAFIKEPFIKIPKPYSAEKIHKFYESRAMSIDQFSLKLSPVEALKTVSLQ